MCFSFLALCSLFGALGRARLTFSAIIVWYCFCWPYCRCWLFGSRFCLVAHRSSSCHSFIASARIRKKFRIVDAMRREMVAIARASPLHAPRQMSAETFAKNIQFLFLTLREIYGWQNIKYVWCCIFGWILCAMCENWWIDEDGGRNTVGKLQPSFRSEAEVQQHHIAVCVWYTEDPTSIVGETGKDCEPAHEKLLHNGSIHYVIIFYIFHISWCETLTCGCECMCVAVHE